MCARPPSASAASSASAARAARRLLGVVPGASLAAVAAAAGGQSFPAGALYVVATPIGNLADLSLRAIHLLALADAIACEDTRHSAPLLRALGIEGKPLLAVHEHNERDRCAQLTGELQAGRRAHTGDFAPGSVARSRTESHHTPEMS